MDLYDVLNIQASASQDEVRNGYLSMSRIHHPDKSSSSSSDAFRSINQAYTILSDPSLREFYDKHGFEATLLAQQDIGEDKQYSLVPAIDKISDLEKRVRRLIRSSKELEAQRFLQPSGSISIGTRILSFSPMYHSWSHSSSSFGVSLLSGKHSVALFASSHVQRGGAAVSRASIVLGTALSPSITTRSIVHLMGGRWPSLECTVQKTITEQTVVRQTVAIDDGKFVLGTEWIQQLADTLVGTIGVTVGATQGMSLELAKKIGGQWLKDYRGKAKVHLTRDGQLAISGKVKYKATEGLEFHAGPSVNVSKGSVSFEVAVQTELEPLVEEQEGAFPTYLTWSLGIEYPEELSVGIKLTRGGFSFNFPIELPAIETKWALIGALAVWTFAPMAINLGKKVLITRKRRKAMEKANNDGGIQSEGEAERKSLEPEAVERRAKEESVNGLVILEAKYANLDVTSVLMARVRDSQLSLSANTKSTLVGIRYPTSGHSLSVRYKYGNTVYERVFKDNDIVLLP